MDLSKGLKPSCLIAQKIKHKQPFIEMKKHKQRLKDLNEQKKDEINQLKTKKIAHSLLKVKPALVDHLYKKKMKKNGNLARNRSHKNRR